MRELVFSVGITFLTGTLLFVYFRNKMNNIDKKVNLVFNTIQEHNSRMQNESEEELKRFHMYHQQQLHEQNINNSVDDPLTENNDIIHKESNNLIDVSDEENEFDSSEDDSDDEQSDDEDSDRENVVNESNKEENLANVTDVTELTDVTDNTVVVDETNKALEIMEDKLEIKTLESLVDYNKLTKAQLRNICEKKELTGWKSLNKGKLILLLQNNN